MKTCNLIFWAIAMPIITFGSEIWNKSDKDLENCKIYKDTQGGGYRGFPSCSSYFGLGWIGIEM